MRFYRLTVLPPDYPDERKLALWRKLLELRVKAAWCVKDDGSTTVDVYAAGNVQFESIKANVQPYL